MDGRADEWSRVSGAATYVADVRSPDALHIAFVHATVPHARITRIDVTAALACEGVVDVIVGDDIGETLLGRAIRDYPVLAGDRVLFAGQRVAAVAASGREQALIAAGLVEIDYAELPPVPDLTAAMALGEDLLHPRYDEYRGAVLDRPGPNTQGVWEILVGDVESALGAAEQIVDTTFRCARSHAAPIEPHSCLVSAGPDRIDVWSTTKEPENLRRLLAEVAGVDPGSVRVHLVPLGGDFGAKGFPFVEVACYALAVRTGRPVRHTMSYEEELTSTAARHPLTLRLRTAVGIDGRLSAVHAESALDGGAFAALKAVPMGVVPVIHAPFGSYGPLARHERCVSYYSTTLPGGHVRSPGEFQALFAAESQMDLIAAELGRDPVEFRLANARDDRVRRVVRELGSVVREWRSTAPPGAGIGVALCFRDTGPGRTTVRAVATPTGVELQVTVADQGAGSYGTFRRLAAEALRVPVQAVHVRARSIGEDDALQDAGAGASRVTAVAGAAVIDACRALAARLGGVPAQTRGFWPSERLAGLGLACLDAEGSAAAGWPPPAGADLRSHAAIAVQLTVDQETGQLVLHRAVVVADTGRVINPVAHRGQLEGGFIYGLSQALLEELPVEDGYVTTASLGDYRIASSADIPPLEVRVLEPAEPGEAILSVGELANVGVAPAIANAIADAVGVRVTELPLTPERILRALEAGPGA